MPLAEGRVRQCRKRNGRPHMCSCLALGGHAVHPRQRAAIMGDDDCSFSMFGSDAGAVAERAQLHWDSWNSVEEPQAPVPTRSGDDDGAIEGGAEDTCSFMPPEAREAELRAKQAVDMATELMDKAIRAAKPTTSDGSQAKASDAASTVPVPPWRSRAADTSPAASPQRSTSAWSDASPPPSPQRSARVWSDTPPAPSPPQCAQLHVPRVVPPPRRYPPACAPPPQQYPPKWAPMRASPAPQGPVAQSVPLRWDQVIYFDDGTGNMKLDHKTLPCQPPRPDMEFKGYHFTNGGKSASAWFVKQGATGPGTRRPNRTGGNTATMFEMEALKRRGSPEEVKDFKRATR